MGDGWRVAGEGCDSTDAGSTDHRGHRNGRVVDSTAAPDAPADGEAHDTSVELEHNEPLVVDGVLTETAQVGILDYLDRGASPAGACLKIGVDYAAFSKTRRVNLGFRSRLSQSATVLGENVAAAVYREAMEGKMPAAALILKTLPPPAWVDAAAAVSRPQDADELDDLDDAELHELARTYGVEVPVEIETRPAAKSG